MVPLRERSGRDHLKTAKQAQADRATDADGLRAESMRTCALARTPASAWGTYATARACIRALSSRAAALPSSVDVAVVGGGSVGAATAYHLARKGLSVALLEAHQLTAGTTWHTAGMLWRLRPSYVENELNAHSRAMALHFEADESIGIKSWHENGGLFIACARERLAEYERLAETGRYYGIESHILTPSEVREVHPLLEVGDVVGALHSPSDGTIDANALVRAYARAARKLGVTVAEGVRVASLETEQTTSPFGEPVTRVLGLRTACGQRVSTALGVVNACGAWAPALAAMAGAQLPLLAMKHAYIVTESIEGMHGDLPNVRDHDLSVYLKAQGSALALGGYEHNPEFWHAVDPDFSFGLFDLDWDTFGQNLDGHFRRCPATETAGVASTVCGPESFTPDHKPLLGPHPGVRGLFNACGFNSAGIMLAGGVARELASWMVDGSSELDLFGYDCARFHPESVADAGWVRARTHEAYAKNYAIVFPHDEPLAGRGARRSALHDALLARGCVFQERHGFERPGWFVRSSADAAAAKAKAEGGAGPAGCLAPRPYDYYGAYPPGDAWRLLPDAGADVGWAAHAEHPYLDALAAELTFGWPGSHARVAAECAAARTGVAIFDQSYFAKLEVRGADAHAALQYVCAADLDGRASGAVVYTPLCNAQGGVEADLTVTRLPPSAAASSAAFYICTGGATATKDREWISRALEGRGYDVSLTDVSAERALLSVQGPHSAALLEALLDGAGREALRALPFASCAELSVAGVPDVRCLRLTFVGELGFELHVPAAHAARVHAALHEAAAPLRAAGVAVEDAGYHAVDSLSAEKGFRHYHADLSAADTPLEAGIGFTVLPKLKSPDAPDFVGRAALERAREAGLRRRLVCVTLDDPAVALHGSGATLWRDGECAGVVRLCAYGHTIGRSIAYGYVRRAAESGAARPDESACDRSGERVTPEWLRGGTWQVGDRGARHAATLHLKAPFDPDNARVRGEYPQPRAAGAAALSEPQPSVTVAAGAGPSPGSSHQQQHASQSQQ